MKAILIGGLLGGLVMFFWGFVAHTVLPLGEIGMHQASEAQQDALLASLKDNLQMGEGVYVVPMDMAAMENPEVAKSFGARALANPYAFIVYQPKGVDMVNNMGGNLALEAGTNVLSALLVGLLVSFATVGYGTRVLLVLGTGLFGWLANAVPMWNWYRFPTEFTLAALVEQGVGWLLAGLVIAWALKRFAR